MSYTVTEQRKQTMLERLGEAAELIDDQRFLPFYRSIQIRLEKAGHADEWGKMIALAKTKTNASKYFATLCKLVKTGKYIFAKATEAVKEVASEASLYLHDKLVKFGFGKYQKYWVRKAQEFINKNGQAGFVDLLELAERKGLSQKYVAKALYNCKSPAKYYRENVLGAAK
jgi:hypothetical protein